MDKLMDAIYKALEGGMAPDEIQDIVNMIIREWKQNHPEDE